MKYYYIILGLGRDINFKYVKIVFKSHSFQILHYSNN